MTALGHAFLEQISRHDAGADGDDDLADDAWADLMASSRLQQDFVLPPRHLTP